LAYAKLELRESVIPSWSLGPRVKALVRILAIETTTFTGSLALCEDDRLIGQSRLPSDSRSAQSLAPAIQAILAEHAWAVESLQLIAVVQGPGSFTGLRVGVTTAKTLAYAINAEVIGIDTLEVLANQAAATPGCIYPIVDAQRGQLFTACFHWRQGKPFPQRQSPTGISDLSAWLSALQPQDVVIGPVANKHAPQLQAIIPPANIIDCEPQAAVAARLAWRDYQLGRRDSLWTLLPHYHRSSAAEEKRAAQIT
jgi:tRNA threonylcarbamoyladenosine biosynthesis protein TsaB